jgi:hypothetical protein
VWLNSSKSNARMMRLHGSGNLVERNRSVFGGILIVLVLGHNATGSKLQVTLK